MDECRPTNTGVLEPEIQEWPPPGLVNMEGAAPTDALLDESTHTFRVSIPVYGEHVRYTAHGHSFAR